MPRPRGILRGPVHHRCPRLPPPLRVKITSPFNPHFANIQNIRTSISINLQISTPESPKSPFYRQSRTSLPACPSEPLGLRNRLMSTLRQIEANRRNAQKSTGPTSVTGKAASSMNALKTGIHAKSLVLPSENPAELERTRRGLLPQPPSHHPRSPLLGRRVHLLRMEPPPPPCRRNPIVATPGSHRIPRSR